MGFYTLATGRCG